MLIILGVVLPVFLIVGAGYGAVKLKLFPDAGVGALMGFTQNFAIPCLLFLALYRLDFSAVFDLALVFSFYFAALVCFALGYVAGRRLFGMTPGESVVMGFACFFSNSVLLGLAITERAYGTEALAPNFALISIHAPILYLVGITAMEIARADGRSAAETARVTLIAMFRNPISMSSGAGIFFNLAGVPLPLAVVEAAEMLGRAALPAALFGLGGVLSRYRIRSTLGPAAAVTVVACLVFPAIVYALTVFVFALPEGFVRSATRRHRRSRLAPSRP
ncbi:MAG: AEC family transporter [Pseudomonadota bacterium]